MDVSNLKSYLLLVKDKNLADRIKGAIGELELIHWVMSDDFDSGELNALISRMYNSQELSKWWLNYLDKCQRLELLVAVAYPEVVARRGEMQANNLTL